MQAVKFILYAYKFITADIIINRLSMTQTNPVQEYKLLCAWFREEEELVIAQSVRIVSPLSSHTIDHIIDRLSMTAHAITNGFA